jgi:hypothetical protein
MMRKLMLLALLVGALVAGRQAAPPARAQNPAIPLVMLSNGDLYSWLPDTGEIVRLSTWGYNFKAVMSPTGQQIAKNAFDRNAPLNPVDPPGNIWVIDPVTGDGERVADQPREAVFASPTGAPDLYVARSNPVWLSPTRLAWTQFFIPDYVQQIVTHDLATGETALLVSDVPLPYEPQGAIDPVAIGGSYIAVPTVYYSEAAGGFVDAVNIYDAFTGQMALGLEVEPINAGAFVLGFAGVSEQGRDQLAVLFSDGIPLVIDPATGVAGYRFQQHFYSTFGTTASLSLSYSLIPRDGTLAWSITFGDGRVITDAVIAGGRFEQMAIAPDGQEFAYIDPTGAVIVWTRPHAIQLPLGAAQALTWGPAAWSVTWPPPYAGG